MIKYLLVLSVLLFTTTTLADSTNDNNSQTNSSGSNTQITGGYTSTTTNNNDGQTNTTTNTTTNNSTTNGSDIPVNSANSPSYSAMSQDVCSMGISGSVSTLGFGVSGGKHVRVQKEQEELARKLAEEQAKLDTLKQQEEVDNIIIETDLKTEEKKIINVHN